MRAKRSILTYFTQTFSTIGLLLLSLLTTPIILKSIGNETYGHYRLILEYISYFGLLEFGLYSTTRILVSEALTKNKDEILSVLRSSFKNYIQIAFISVLVLFIVTLFKNLIPQFNVINERQLYLSALFVGLGFIIIPFHTFKAAMESEQRGYIVEVANFINKSLNIILILIFAFTKIELYSFFLVIFIANLISYAYILYKSNWRIRDLLAKSPSLDKKTISTRFDVFLFDLAGKINLSSDSIIISFFYSAEIVTIFFISQRLSGVVSNFIYGASNSLWPALSNMYFNKEYEQLKEKILFSTRLCSFMAIFFLTPVLFLNNAFISLWVGSQYIAGPLFSIIIVSNIFIQTILSLWGWLISSTNNTSLARKNLLISTTSNLILSLLFTKYFGIIGPILGTLATSLLFSINLNLFILRKLFKLNLMELFLSWLKPTFYLTTLMILYYFIYPHNLEVSYVSFTLQGFAFTVLNLIICALLLLKREDRIYLLEKVRKVRV